MINIIIIISIFLINIYINFPILYYYNKENNY
jgi:hypothetical protein